MKLSESSFETWSNSVLFPETPKYKQSRAWTWGRQTWLGEVSRGSKKFAHEMSSWLGLQKATVPSVAKLEASIALLEAGGADATAPDMGDEAPIFVLSTGARAGSTLLQRLLITEPRLLLWGEPLGEMALVSRLAEMLTHLEQPRKVATWRLQVDANSPALAESWIACLYPSVNYFRLALRNLFDEWLAKPSRERGFTRWGFKEVRLSATEASLLHWVYPKAKFVVTCRHPFNSYRSFADSHWVGYYRYPEVRVDSAAAFAHHWNRMAMSWAELPADFPCFHMKYEDLVRGNVDFRKLESWLGIEIKEEVALSARVGGTTKRASLTWYERMIISREAEAGMRAMGYSSNP